MVNVLKWYSHLFALLVCLTDFLIASLLTSFHLHLMASLTACRFTNSSHHTLYQGSAKYVKSNNLDALTISLLFRKFSCSLSTSPFFFRMTSYNYWQFVSWEHHYQQKTSELSKYAISVIQFDSHLTSSHYSVTSVMLLQFGTNCSIHTRKEFILYVVYVLLQ